MLGDQYLKSAHPTVVPSVAQCKSTSHEIGEFWVRFPLGASDVSSIVHLSVDEPIL